MSPALAGRFFTAGPPGKADCLLSWALVALNSLGALYSLLMWISVTQERLKTHQGDISMHHMVSHTPCRSDRGSSPYLDLGEELTRQDVFPHVWTSAVPASPSLRRFPGSISCLPPPPTLCISHLRRGCAFQPGAEWPAGSRSRVLSPAFQPVADASAGPDRPFGDHTSQSAWVSSQLRLSSLIIVHGDTCHSQNALLDRQMSWST